MGSLEPFCVLRLDSLPTVKLSCVRQENRVLREERGHGGGIIVVECLGILVINLRDKLVDYL